jgi:insulysin
MLDFHRKWYSANLMTLCVLNNNSLEELEKQISELFSQVVNKNVSKMDMSQPVPFDLHNTSKLIKFVPVKDKDLLTVIWSLDYVQENFQSQPLRYISALFGHEGKNSLLSYLIEEDLAVTLSSSDTHDYDSITMFQV